MGGLSLSLLKRFAHILSLIVACFVTLLGGLLLLVNNWLYPLFSI